MVLVFDQNVRSGWRAKYFYSAGINMICSEDATKKNKTIPSISTYEKCQQSRECYKCGTRQGTMRKDFPFRQRISDFPYVCVHCGNPSKSLYHQLGASLSSIKVLTCTKCEEIIDPYIEREWLHIAIDCILMRLEAYHHILYNSDAFQEMSKKQRIQLLFVWACLDTFVKWESHKFDVGESSQLLQSKGFIFSLLMTSFIGRVLEWLAVSMYGRRGSKKSSSDDKDSISDKLFLALMLPSSFTIVTMLVMMWDNTTTVRLLGSLMIASWQGLAVSVVSGDLLGPWVVFATRIMWKAAIAAVDLPCKGTCKWLSNHGDLLLVLESF